MNLITNRCPAMLIFPTDVDGVRITDELFTDVTLEYGSKRLKGYLRFPQTLVNRTNILHWVVDPCTATGYLFEDAGLAKITVSLDSEYVIGPLAKPVDATGTATLQDGTVLNLLLTYPAVLAIPKGNKMWLVNSVQAFGSVVLPTENK